MTPPPIPSTKAIGPEGQRIGGGVKKIPCAIVVLNYQGLEELKRCFASVVAACEHDDWIHELILLDNHSTDGSPEWVETHFPRVRVVRRPDNLVVHAFNEIAKELSHEFCIFVNNDFIVERTIIQKLLRHFQDSEVAAVSALWVRHLAGGVGSPVPEKIPRQVHTFQLMRGFLEMKVVPLRPNTPPYTFLASSHCTAYRREKFLELGGYDPLFFPLSWMDADFSYRLWKAGYKIAHERESYVLDGQPGNTTTPVFGERYAHLICNRNRLLTTWLNVTDKKILGKSFLYALVDLVNAVLRFHPTLFIPYWWCLKRLPAILKARRNRHVMAKLSDTKVLGILQSLG